MKSRHRFQKHLIPRRGPRLTGVVWVCVSNVGCQSVAWFAFKYLFVKYKSCWDWNLWESDSCFCCCLMEQLNLLGKQKDALYKHIILGEVWNNSSRKCLLPLHIYRYITLDHSLCGPSATKKVSDSANAEKLESMSLRRQTFSWKPEKTSSGHFRFLFHWSIPVANTVFVMQKCSVTVPSSWWTGLISLFNFYLFIFGCAGASLPQELFSRCSKWGILSDCVLRLLISGASLAAKHRLRVCGLQ